MMLKFLIKSILVSSLFFTGCAVKTEQLRSESSKQSKQTEVEQFTQKMSDTVEELEEFKYRVNKTKRTADTEKQLNPFDSYILKQAGQKQ